MTKKILMVNKFYEPKIGGIESVVKQYAQFASSKYDVTVLCVAESKSSKTSIELVDGIKVVRCSSLGTFKGLPLSFSFLYNFLKFALKADLIHGHYPFPLLDLVLSILPPGRKILVTWHSEIVRQKYLKLLFYPFTVLMLRRSWVSVTSNRLRENSKFLYKRKSRLTVLPLSIEADVVPQEIIEKSVICDRFDRVIPKSYALSLGRIANYKGIDVLIEAFNNTKTDLPLVIAGDGPLLESVIKRVESSESLKERVFILGRAVSDIEKAILFERCQFFVFPSTLPSEAFGIVQLEAMSKSKPVINTKLKSGVPWVSLHMETGMTCEVNDVKSLSNAISKLSDEKLCSELGVKAKDRYLENFSDDVISKRYKNLLEVILNEK